MNTEPGVPHSACTDGYQNNNPLIEAINIEAEPRYTPGIDGYRINNGFVINTEPGVPQSACTGGYQNNDPVMHALIQAMIVQPASHNSNTASTDRTLSDGHQVYQWSAPSTPNSQYPVAAI